MKRRDFLIGAGVVAGGGLTTAAMIPGQLEAGLQLAQSAIDTRKDPLVRINFQRDLLQPEPWAEKLISAAEDQIGVTLIYDPAYVGLSFPNGDLPRERGVCTDVVVRAYRDAFGFDLQKEVNADMKRHFASYPKIWGLKRPDRNIDHRRVPNLRTFFERKGASLPVSDRSGDYFPGDVVSQMLPGNLPHMAIVTQHRSQDGKRPLIIHNIGAGTRLEDTLFEFEITGRYRFKPGISS
ncbi:DUF1287 domain-containing protein [uncultured Roseibium sp.]|uniref:DUF1287 domain-containing protein n=1 Tax=uncultured Roseibium sp. TaxID=1936171 RepID=UPI002635B6F2|nr:DUF1287 domain-containing protein [uncultured Roseibium sp.]